MLSEGQDPTVAHKVLTERPLLKYKLKNKLYYAFFIYLMERHTAVQMKCIIVIRAGVVILSLVNWFRDFSMLLGD